MRFARIAGNEVAGWFVHPQEALLFVNRLLPILLIVAYALPCLGPRGAALCVGGGHEWNQVIAAKCESTPSGHTHCGTESCESVACAMCDHHQQPEHAPCTDIPLGSEEVRPRSGQVDLKFPASFMMLADAFRACTSAWPQVVARPQHVLHWASPGPPKAITASLRAVVLLI